MPSLHKPYQTVTRNGCIGFCKTTGGLYENGNFASNEKIISFDKIEIIVQFLIGPISPKVVQTNENRLITFNGDNILNILTKWHGPVDTNTYNSFITD